MNEISIPRISAPSLICGEDYAISFYSGTYLPVLSTTNASPIVVTVAKHGFSSGDTKLLDGCTDEAANGTHVITVIDANTFSIPVAGTTTGRVEGVCTTPFDISGQTVRATLRNAKSSGTILPQQFTIAVNDSTLCDITLSISHTDTKAIQDLTVTELYADVWADNVPLCTITIPVYPAGTIF